jgi:hypothetical protein
MTAPSFCFCATHNVDLVSAFVHILGINDVFSPPTFLQTMPGHLCKGIVGQTTEVTLSLQAVENQRGAILNFLRMA